MIKGILNSIKKAYVCVLTKLSADNDFLINEMIMNMKTPEEVNAVFHEFRKIDHKGKRNNLTLLNKWNRKKNRLKYAYRELDPSYDNKRGMQIFKELRRKAQQN